MAKEWERDELMAMTRAFQPACLIMAAVELGVFDVLTGEPRTAGYVAGELAGDARGVTVLLDALAGLELLGKEDDRYTCAANVREVFTRTAPDSAFYMVRHLSNCLRRWSGLARVVKTGRPTEPDSSILGPVGDTESFIEAMNDLCRRTAPALVAGLDLPRFSHLLDVGGGPATWTIAFLRRNLQARATVFDLPEVIPIAHRHVEEAGLGARVEFMAGDFLKDELPQGPDLVWVSAIVHMNSREENRHLFGKAFRALVPGGSLLIRDVVMDRTRTRPPMGALFAANMLVSTEGGGTFTFEELAQDLEASGFTDPGLLHEEPTMNSVIVARKA